MHLYRAMLYLLVAVAIILAPMAAAWADGAVRTQVAMPHAGEDEGNEVPAPMEDCASMVKGGAGPSDCPHCNKDKVCPPELCFAKCFHLIGLAPELSELVRPKSARHRLAGFRYPPDWSDQPQPPPPRT